ncbi:hypothetical protein KFU94_40510 [Chloroflexi bacterium TSY]|nr:hypothetical protein [Chloroflexi bacterium TSY]
MSQGQQLHIVLAQGLQIMEEYFPGFTAELAAGVPLSAMISLWICAGSATAATVPKRRQD